MALENSVSIETGATTVVGNVTNFVAAEGDLLIVDGITAIIAAAPSTSSLTLAKPWPGPAVVESTNWQIFNIGPYWRSTVTTNKLVTELLRKVDGGLPLKPDATGSLAKRAEYNSQTEGFLFLQTDVDPFLLYVKTGPNATDWSTGQRLRADPAASTVEAQQAAAAAAASAGTANARANDAQTSAGNAAASEGRAHDWAEKPVDQDVAGPGTRSALHHSAKAAAAQAAAELAASQAQQGVVPDNGVTTQKLADGAVTNAKLTAVPTSTLKGRSAAGTGNVQDLTAAQAKTLLSLNNVDNTSDANKPVSTAQQTALNAKVDKASLGALYASTATSVGSANNSENNAGSVTWTAQSPFTLIVLYGNMLSPASAFTNAQSRIATSSGPTSNSAVASLPAGGYSQNFFLLMILPTTVGQSYTAYHYFKSSDAGTVGTTNGLIAAYRLG